MKKTEDKAPVRPESFLDSGMYIIARYSKEAWMQLFPDSTEAAWEDYFMPNKLMAFIDTASEEFDEFLPVKLVLLNTEYLDWLKSNNKRNTSKARREYCIEMTEEKASSLMLEDGMGIQLNMLYAPVCLWHDSSDDSFPAVTRYILPEVSRREYENCISQVCGGEVSVSRFLFSEKQLTLPAGDERLHVYTTMSDSFRRTDPLPDADSIQLNEEGQHQIVLFSPVIAISQIRDSIIDFNELTSGQTRALFPDLLEYPMLDSLIPINAFGDGIEAEVYSRLITQNDLESSASAQKEQAH